MSDDSGSDDDDEDGDNEEEDLDAVIHSACSVGDSASVKELLEYGASVNAVDEHGLSCLHVASESGHVATMAVLLDAKPAADVNAVDRRGQTSLHRAVHVGQHEATALLLAHGADVEQICMVSGLTPMQIASRFGHEAVVHALRGHGAFEGEGCNCGKTPLREVVALCVSEWEHSTAVNSALTPSSTDADDDIQRCVGADT